MHECTSITINSFHLFQQTLFNKGSVAEVAGSPERANEKELREETCQAYLYADPVKKKCLIFSFFKQQIEFLLISCLPVAKSFIQKV